MSFIHRISSGFVLKDDFTDPLLNPVWQVSPSDDARFSLTERPGYLRLKHGEPDLYILMNAPRFDFVFEADTHYVPISEGDEGGLIAFLDVNAYIELIEYYDEKTGTMYAYDRLRLVRKGDLWEGYGSNDNGYTWEMIGTSFLAAPKVGFVLRGKQEAKSAPLDVNRVRIYKSTNIQIGNLVAGQRVDFVHENGTLIGSEVCQANKDYVEINCSRVVFPINGTIRIYDAAGFLLDESDVFTDIWGGDIFWYGVRLDFEIDGLLLPSDREYQLGNMENGIIERKGYIINNNDIPIYNVKARIEAASDYYGWEWVDLAPDSFGEPGLYRDVVDVGTIQPGHRVPIWIKITRQPYQQVASLHDYKFRIVFESG